MESGFWYAVYVCACMRARTLIAHEWVDGFHSCLVLKSSSDIGQCPVNMNIL
jgi:hypothetical protein